MGNCEVKLYVVSNCKVSYTEVWSGYVLNINDEPIIDSIKRKLGRTSLLCELTNEGFNYQIASLFSAPITEFSVGDIMLLNGNTSILN
jgi:hypothetical protein